MRREELDDKTFKSLRGLTVTAPQARAHDAFADEDADIIDGDDGDGDFDAKPNKGSKKAKLTAAADNKPKTGKDEVRYYRLTCRDNGCGMPHDKVPDMLGRVLSGSKYGVRQTRGKFGLGAKMALIWSKKSTGLPIEVTTAHISSKKQAAAAAEEVAGLAAVRKSSAAVAANVTFCRLDIDIYKNIPRVLEHTSKPNTAGWSGTEISAVISGAWSSYRSRIMQYFQQLAVITPYAEFTLEFEDQLGKGKSDFTYCWKRRSTHIPRPPLEVKHHPKAVNDLLIQQLIDLVPESSSQSSLLNFLTSQFQRIDKSLAQSIISDASRSGVGKEIAPDVNVHTFDSKHVHCLRVAMEKHDYAAPSAACLSPAGEYNLRLGILKELKPDLVATSSSAVQVFQGHPFIVEAGVALGGSGSSGLTVHRFANRIPLLFEGGADVVTQTAMKRIAWATYKIDPARDKIAVFVSIVSTKIPFKGTGKEYIGDDIEEIRDTIRSCLQSCCSQLRVKLVRASELRAKANRRKILAKYVPDVCRALRAALISMNDRTDTDATVEAGRPNAVKSVLNDYRAQKFSDNTLSLRLLEAVDKADLDSAFDAAAATLTSGILGLGANDLTVGSSGRNGFVMPLFAEQKRKMLSFVQHKTASADVDKKPLSDDVSSKADGSGSQLTAVPSFGWAFQLLPGCLATPESFAADLAADNDL
jgi:DNA topoisomerase-6 subunit B